MHPMFRPRRIAIFLLILLAGGSVGVTAVGFETTTTDLPAEFTPAQPLPGDKAEWAYVLVEDGIASENAIPFFRLEALAPEATWNETGVPHIAYPVRTLEAHYPTSSNDDAPSNIKWFWNLTDAYGADGEVWFEDNTHQSEPGGSDTFRFESQSHSRTYLSGRSTIMRNCLINALPADFDIHEPVELRNCFAEMPRGDPDRPVRSANEAQARFGSVSGKGVLAGAWHAIGQSQTPYGAALVMEYRYDGEPWGIQAWFVEAFPYPVQMSVEGDGRTWIHQVTSFTRGTRVAVPSQRAPLPAPVERPLRAWGPDESGISAGMMPSEAYEAALDDAASGLSDWLDAHPGAYVETLHGGDAKDGDSDWTLQWRAGNERFAVRVEWSDKTLEQFPFYGIPYKVASVEDVEPQPVRYSTPSAPARVPDLASASVRFAAATDLQAQRWTYTWGCTDWVRHDPCEEIAGPVVHAEATVIEDSGPVLPAVEGEESTETTWTMFSRPDGGIAGLRASIWSTSYQGLASSPSPQDAAPVQSVRPTSAAMAWQPPSASSVAAVGAATGLLAFLYLFWPAIKAAPLALFSRIRKDKLLDHPNRQRLYDAIEATPGIHHGALVDMLGQGRGTVDHHLRKLEDGGLIRARSSDGYRCYFIAAVDRRVMDAAPVLRSETARRVLAHVRDHPGATGGQVAAAVGVNRSTVSHHVKRLEGAGLLRGERSGNAIRLWTVAGMVTVAAPLVPA